MELTIRKKMTTRTEELKQLIWDHKLKDEIQSLCEMVNPGVSASLVQDISNAIEKRIRWAIELGKLEPEVKVLSPLSENEE